MGLIPNQEYLFLLLENKIVNLYNLAKAHFIGKYSCYTTNPASADYKNLKLELENDSYNWSLYASEKILNNFQQKQAFERSAQCATMHPLANLRS
jgi:hypothetical protein